MALTPAPYHSETQVYRTELTSFPDLRLLSGFPSHTDTAWSESWTASSLQTRSPRPDADPRRCGSAVRERERQHIVVGEDAHGPTPLPPQPEGQRTRKSRLSGRRQAAEDAQSQLRLSVAASGPTARRGLHAPAAVSRTLCARCARAVSQHHAAPSGDIGEEQARMRVQRRCLGPSCHSDGPLDLVNNGCQLSLTLVP